ncbi:MAG: ABC transporter ATP-binding protein [Clostridia bacterium]|nr:ABC transporter ATP-binding protein [Clostridia bacterium]
MKKNTEKNNHGILSNTWYMLRLMFSVSPGLVIGEILEEIITILPGKLISVIGIKYVIDEVQGGGDVKRIITGVAMMVGIMILANVYSSIFYELYGYRERERMYLGIHSKLYNKAIELDLAKYDNPSFYADFILAVQTSSENIQSFLENIRHYVAQIISFISISAVLLTIDPVCLLIVFAFVFGFVPLGRYLGNLQMRRREAIIEKERKSDYFARLFYLQDYAGEIRTSGIKKLLLKRFDESVDDTYRTEGKFLKKLEWGFFFQETGIQVIGFMLALTAYIGYQTLVTGKLGAGDFIAAFNGAVQIGASILYLTVYSIRTFTERSKMIEKYRTFLASKTDIVGGKEVAPCDKPETIRIKNAGFVYEGSSKKALENIDIEIKPYEKIALVGYNGAGKTTLTNLLLRLYDVTEGAIEIGGVDIRDVTVDSHRARFSAVFQDFQIFSATVAENVALSVDYDKERVWQALKAAGFNKELPDGLDTVLLREFDDEGMMLSGGEQQKIAIARAFYKKCPYVILDEPSANLDPVSEYELNHAMMEASEEKTVIFISHRLSTTRHADRILMMEKGRVIESGSHEELMALGGKYAEMFSLQAEKYNDAI